MLVGEGRGVWESELMVEQCLERLMIARRL